MCGAGGGLVRAISVLALIGMLAARANAADAPPVELTDRELPGAELLGFSGNPQVVRVALWFFQHGSSARPCTVVHLRLADTVTTATVLTTGLGRALLAVVPHPATGCDPRFTLDWREQLQLNNYGSKKVRDWTLAVLPDATPLEADGTAMEGQIIAFAPGAGTVAVPVKVERLPLSPIMSALLWTIGIVLPAGLSYVLARAADSWNERRKVTLDREAELVKQREAFATWRQEEEARTAISALLEELKAVRDTKDYQEPCHHLLNFMYGRGMLISMPSQARERLNMVCTAERRQELLDMLRELFPEVQTDIPATWN
jgi:hypothetical protein